jgi:hypothetical protein
MLDPGEVTGRWGDFERSTRAVVGAVAEAGNVDATTTGWKDVSGRATTSAIAIAPGGYSGVVSATIPRTPLRVGQHRTRRLTREHWVGECYDGLDGLPLSRQQPDSTTSGPAAQGAQIFRLPLRKEQC